MPGDERLYCVLLDLHMRSTCRCQKVKIRRFLVFEAASLKSTNLTVNGARVRRSAVRKPRAGLRLPSRGNPTVSATMRQTHAAGEKLFVDFAGNTVAVIDPVTGDKRQAHIFVSALGASNFTDRSLPAAAA
jgi:hypothetical protein